MPITLTSNEKRTGCAYLAISLFLLPGLISLLPLNAAGQNLVYYLFNFTAVVGIFRKFLRMNLLVALDRVFPVIWYGILGYLGYQTLGELLEQHKEALSEREYKLFVLRYLEGKTAAEIAEQEGISPERVCQLNNKVIRKLRSVSRQRREKIRDFYE